MTRTMSSQTVFVMSAGVLTMCLLGLVGGAPQRRTVDLPHALNRSVCPIEVEIDEDEARVPRRIKLLKCAPPPNEYCKAAGIPDKECCTGHKERHIHNHFVMRCTEIYDTVLVYYPNSTSPLKAKTYPVAVGCTCLIGPVAQAGTAT